jgi:hypothetical protein
VRRYSFDGTALAFRQPAPGKISRKDAMNRGRRNEILILVIVLMALFLVFSVSFRHGHHWGDDFSQYIVQARAVVDGSVQDTYEESKYRYDYSENKLIGPVLYPWGYPLLLSAVYALRGFDILAMKAFTSLFFLLSLAVVFFLFRGRITFTRNLLIVVLLGINPAFFEARDDVLSDFPFLFFSLLSLLLMQRTVVDRKTLAGPLGDSVLIGACMFLSFSTRMAGVVLLPTLLLVQLVESVRSYRLSRTLPFRFTAFLAPYAVFFVLASALEIWLPSSSSYADQLGDFGWGSVTRNLMLYAKLPVDFFTTSMGPWLTVAGKLLFLISIPALCLGAVRTAGGSCLFILFPALYMALLIAWPGVQGLRFMFPVMPFFLLFLFQGMDGAASRLSLMPGQRLGVLSPAAAYGAVALLIFGATSLGQAFRAVQHPGYVLDGPYTRDSASLFGFIAHNTRKDDVVIFSKPRAMWLFAGRRSVRLSRLEDIMVSEARFIACRRDDPVDKALHNKIWIAKKVYVNDSFSLYARMSARPEPMKTGSDPPVRKVSGTKGGQGAKKKGPGKRRTVTIEIRL